MTYLELLEDTHKHKESQTIKSGRAQRTINAVSGKLSETLSQRSSKADDNSAADSTQLTPEEIDNIYIEVFFIYQIYF